ncbi:hypothetical protein [Priestia megaterium]|uniref:hypothetical protein n=1 Tax=Priestia megaterium TaxID=1404 RepID=UPI002E245CA1|nr:hypothetical protein [Priestia megaterium]MED4278292.1 hypothetical protein [Priestia megaterium]MED4314397.1 hypothetical protein [Priestia megaterium]
MEIILSQLVHLEPMNEGWTTVKKSFESNVIPHKGDYITDSVWKADDEQEVASVEINYQENYCYVHLKPIELKTNDENVLRDYVKMTKLHGWESMMETY